MHEKDVRWVGQRGSRAKPIPAERWEQHRSKICQIYQKSTLEDVMAILKDNHQFIPSRRQYVSQLQKWGVHKNSTSSTGPSLPNPNYSSLQDSVARLQHKGNDVEEMNIDPASILASPSQVQREDRQARTHTETALSLDIEIQDVYLEGGACGAGQACQPSADRQSNQAAPVVRLHHGMYPSLEPNPNKETVEETFLTSNLPQVPRHISSLTHPKDETLETDFMLASASTNNKYLDNILGCHRSNVQANGYFGLGAISGEKILADLLLVCQCYQDSFPLYQSVLEDFNRDSATPMSKIASAIIGCARSCTTSFQMHVLQGLVEDIFLERKAIVEETAEDLLCKLLLADILYSQGHYGAGQCCDRSAMQSYFAQDESAWNGRGEKAFSPVMEYYLSQTLRRESDLPTAALTSSVSQRNAARVQIVSIRSCLQWCIHEWTKDQSIFNPLDTLLKGAGGASLAFFELWWRWISQVSRTTHSWNYGAEHHLGMSPSELLFVTCLAMCDAVPATEGDDRYFSSGSVFESIPQQALEGGLKLSNCSDASMARHFQASFASCSSHTKSPNARQTTFRSLAPYRDELMEFIQGTLGLKLPKAPQLNSHNLSRLDHSNAAILRSSVSCRSYRGTIASSLYSLDFESQRVLMKRINKRAESLKKKLDLYRPSSVMSDFRGSSVDWVGPFLSGNLSRSSFSTGRSRYAENDDYKSL
ncbi:MAG: hypothetical protein Q9160_003807 [Pyrenula sp. 1 TL-2023]